MSRKKETLNATFTLENALISNFMRLCAAMGMAAETAYRELEVRLEALDELKPHRMCT